MNPPPFKKRSPLQPLQPQDPKPKPPRTTHIRAVKMPGEMITKRLIKPVGLALLLLALNAWAGTQVTAPQGNAPATFPFGGGGSGSGSTTIACAGGTYTKTGTFPVLNTVAASGSTMTCNGACEAAFLWVFTGTATGNLQRSIDAGAHWIDVVASTISAQDIQTITLPNGLYRPTLTICTGCTATVSWSCVP